jgi:hypothetical protein
MTRTFAGHGRARSGALIVTVVGALLVPLATAWADSGGPPEGSGRSMSSATLARCDVFECSTVTFDAKELGTTRSVCVEVDTTSPDGQTIYAQQYGCNFDTVGAWLVSGGYITGVAATPVTLNSSLGGTWDIVVSANTAIAGEATATIEKLDGSDATCTITWTVKERRIPVAGSVTVNGVVYTTGSDSVSTIRNVKEKSSC